MSPTRSVLATVLLAIAAVLLVTLPPSFTTDGWARYSALNQLLDSGTIPDSRYSLIGPLFAAPLWLAGHGTDPVTAVWYFNKVVALVAAVGLWWAVRPVLSEAVAWRFLLVLAYASMVPAYLLDFGGETFTAACVGVGTGAAVIRRAWWGWPLAALGAANTPATIVGLAVAAGIHCWDARRLRYGLAVLLAAALVLAENWVRRGHPLASGYDNDHGIPTILPYSGQPGFSYPFFFGLLSIFFSFGKGLIFFAPGLFVPFESSTTNLRDPAADLRVLYRVWVGFVVGLVLVYARWWAWYGGDCWGPRFFLFAALPASLVLARRSISPLPQRLVPTFLVLTALLLSCWVAASGAVYHKYGDAAYLGDGYAVEFVLWYVPECSPLWRPFVDPKPLDRADVLRLTAFAIAAVYLAWPVAGAISRSIRDRVRHGWIDLRENLRFRF